VEISERGNNFSQISQNGTLADSRRKLGMGSGEWRLEVRDWRLENGD